MTVNDSKPNIHPQEPVQTLTHLFKSYGVLSSYYEFLKNKLLLFTKAYFLQAQLIQNSIFATSITSSVLDQNIHI